MSKKYSNKELLKIFNLKVNRKSLKKAIKSGANISGVDNRGWNFLMQVAEKGDIKSLNILIEAKADVDFQCKPGGYTALMLAAEKGHLDCVKALATVVGDINEYSWYGDFAVGLAARSGHDECTKALLDAGASNDTMPRLSLKEKYADYAQMVKDKAKNKAKKSALSKPNKL